MNWFIGKKEREERLRQEVLDCLDRKGKERWLNKYNKLKENKINKKQSQPTKLNFKNVKNHWSIDQWHDAKASSQLDGPVVLEHAQKYTTIHNWIADFVHWSNRPVVYFRHIKLQPTTPAHSNQPSLALCKAAKPTNHLFNSSPPKQTTRDSSSNRQHSLPAIALVILLAMLCMVIIKPAFTGMATYKVSYSRELNLSFIENGQESITLLGAPLSLRLSGEGFGEVYLVKGEERYLIVSANGTFSEECVETCSLDGFGSEIVLGINVENSTLNLNGVSYTVLEMLVEETNETA